MNSMEKWSTSTALAASSKDQMESAPKLDFNEDLYKVLEVDPSVDSNMLKKAYHKIVFKYHPDNKVGEREKDLANRQMMVINAAYKVLKNSDERKKYDRKRLYQTQTSDKSKSDFSQKSGFVDSSRPYSRTERQPEENESVESIFDILGDLWKDVQSNSGANLMDDFMDFLDGKVDKFLYTDCNKTVYD